MRYSKILTAPTAPWTAPTSKSRRGRGAVVGAVYPARSTLRGGDLDVGCEALFEVLSSFRRKALCFFASMTSFASNGTVRWKNLNFALTLVVQILWIYINVKKIGSVSWKKVKIRLWSTFWVKLLFFCSKSKFVSFFDQIALKQRCWVKKPTLQNQIGFPLKLLHFLIQ